MIILNWPLGGVFGLGVICFQSWLWRIRSVVWSINWVIQQLLSHLNTVVPHNIRSNNNQSKLNFSKSTFLFFMFLFFQLVLKCDLLCFKTILCWYSRNSLPYFPTLHTQTPHLLCCVGCNTDFIKLTVYYNLSFACFQGTNEILRMYIALTGMQYAGKVLTGKIK